MFLGSWSQCFSYGSCLGLPEKQIPEPLFIGCFLAHTAIWLPNGTRNWAKNQQKIGSEKGDYFLFRGVNRFLLSEKEPSYPLWTWKTKSNPWHILLSSCGRAVVRETVIEPLNKDAHHHSFYKHLISTAVSAKKATPTNGKSHELGFCQRRKRYLDCKAVNILPEALLFFFPLVLSISFPSTLPVFQTEQQLRHLWAVKVLPAEASVRRFTPVLQNQDISEHLRAWQITRQSLHLNVVADEICQWFEWIHKICNILEMELSLPQGEILYQYLVSPRGYAVFVLAQLWP